MNPPALFRSDFFVGLGPGTPVGTTVDTFFRSSANACVLALLNRWLNDNLFSKAGRSRLHVLDGISWCFLAVCCQCTVHGRARSGPVGWRSLAAHELLPRRLPLPA